MSKKSCLANLVLLVSNLGALGLTASSFVTCGTFEPDEFLDLAQARQDSILPILTPHWNVHPCFFLSLKTFHLPGSNLLAVCLRC